MDNNLLVTYVTHACIKIKGDFGCLITDPWILNEPVYAFTTWKFPAAIIPPSVVVQDVQYLFISHPHEDHLHIPSLNHFSRDICILLPEYADYPCLRAQTVERTFRALGFHNIRKIMPFETIMLTEESAFTLIPSAKSKYWDWENSGFVLESGGVKLLNMNDCPSDEEVYKTLNEKFGEIDIGFVQYSGVSMFPGCFRMPVEAMKEASQKRKHSWIQQKNMIEMLKVKRLAPFAGDFAWLDERMYHCNWSNRATPKLFEDFVKTNYPEQNIDVVIMYPSDEWSLQSGLIRNHPEIDWDNYMVHIDALKDHLSPKVKKLAQWLDGADAEHLKFRTATYLENSNQWLQNWNIDFNVNARIVVESDVTLFEFYMCADPVQGFRFSWEAPAHIDHSLYIRAPLWAAVLEGRVLLTNIQWAAQQEEHVPFRAEIARFWFWFENHVDLNNRNVQALIDDALHPGLKERIRPNLGSFPLDEEWDLPWVKSA